MKEFFRATSENAPKSGDEAKVIDKNELMEERGKSPGEWNIEDSNVEIQFVIITQLIIANSKKEACG